MKNCFMHLEAHKHSVIHFLASEHCPGRCGTPASMKTGVRGPEVEAAGIAGLARGVQANAMSEARDVLKESLGGGAPREP